MSEETIVQLDPAKVLADSNIRFGLKATAIQSMKDSILEQGGIIEPVEVEALTGDKKHSHRLTVGFIRHAATLALNSEQNAGLTLPAIVREPGTDTDRLRRQIAENNDRENLSPMDKANAIRRLLDSGIARAEIRRVFSSAGGRKGNTVQPMSNAMLNIYAKLLDLPKTIQEKIHDGRVGVEAAYMLGKVTPEKRAAVLERAEADRQAQIDVEERDEQKYLLSESKAAEAEAKAAAATTAVEQAKQDVIAGTTLVEEKKAALKEVSQLPGYLDLPEKEKKEVTEKLKAAQVDVKAAEKLLKDAKNQLAKSLGSAKTAAEVAEEQKAKLEAARKLATRSAKPISKQDVAKATKEVDTDAGAVPLGASEIRQVVKDLIRDGVPSRVQQVAKLFKDCFDGKDTPKELQHNLTVFFTAVENSAREKALAGTAAGGKTVKA